VLVCFFWTTMHHMSGSVPVRHVHIPRTPHTHNTHTHTPHTHRTHTPHHHTHTSHISHIPHTQHTTHTPHIPHTPHTLPIPHTLHIPHTTHTQPTAGGDPSSSKRGKRQFVGLDNMVIAEIAKHSQWHCGFISSLQGNSCYTTTRRFEVLSCSIR
jgi:hypothetical protein